MVACALLPAAAVAVAAAGAVAVALGDPRWLEGERDYHSRVCDEDSGRWIYWPRPPDLDERVCVGRCPDAMDVVSSKRVELPVEGAPLSVSSTAGGLELTQSLRLLEVPVYPAEASFGRFCLPRPEAALYSIGAPAGDAEAEVEGGEVVRYAATALLEPLRRGVASSTSEQLRRVVGDLRRSGRDAGLSAGVAAVGVAFVAGGASALSVSCCPPAVAAFAAVACSLVCLCVGIDVLILWQRAARDFRVLAVAGLLPAAALILGLALVLIACALPLAALRGRRSLSRAARLVGVALALLRSEPKLRSLWLLAPLAATAQLGGLVACCHLLPWALSVASWSWPPLNTAHPTGNVSWDSSASLQASDPLDGAMPVAFGLARGLVYHDTACAALAAVLLLGLRTWLLFVDSLTGLTVAYVVSAAYFGARRLDQVGSGALLCRAAGAVVRYHLGSAASRAAMLAAIPLPVRAARALVFGAGSGARRLPGSPAFSTSGGEEEDAALPAAEFWLSPAGLADVALRGSACGEARVATADAISTALPAVRCLSGAPALLGVLVLLPLSLMVWPVGVRLTEIETAKVPAGLLLALFAYTAASAWVSLWEAVSDALLFCLAADDAAHRTFRDAGGGPQGGADHVADIDMEMVPSITASTSYALWSSPYTPPRLRAFLYDLSLSIRDDVGRGAVDDAGAGTSRTGAEASDSTGKTTA